MRCAVAARASCTSRPTSWRASAPRRPRVHCITNAVAQTFTANMLLAAGAVPSMTIAPKEVGAFVARADALLVNLGTFDAERREAIGSPIAVAQQARRALGARSGVHRPLAAARRRSPSRWWRSSRSAVRLNAAEFAALAGAARRTSSARALCAETQDAWSALTGATDLVTDGARLAAHRQRPSADGARHRDGLRRLGAGRGLPRGRARRAGSRPRRRCSLFGVAGEVAARARARPRQLRGRRSSMRCTRSTAPR